MHSVRQQDGFTLVEVLIVSVLMIVVLGATLTALSSFQRNISVNQKQNVAQDTARTGMDLMARDLRNLASPTRDQPLALDLNLAHDIVFQAEGRAKPADSFNASNTTRVRYCLGPDRKVYRQVQTWKSAAFAGMPSTAACPGAVGAEGTAAWTNGLTRVVAENVSNGTTRPLFSYNAFDPRDVTEVNMVLFVDATPAAPPAETTLQSAVYLRNQNRKPDAVFSVALANSGTAIIMNASESTDPEEKPLTFQWYLDGAPLANATKVVHTATVSAGPHSVYVRVFDGPLYDDADPQPICVPSPAQGVTCTPTP
jgi:type II secretory pathway pseudopilin PulG